MNIDNNARRRINAFNLYLFISASRQYIKRWTSTVKPLIGCLPPLSTILSHNVFLNNLFVKLATHNNSQT